MSLFKAFVRLQLNNKKISSYSRFLFIGPHPDDVELGCGALAAKLAFLKKKVSFLICTDGRYGNKYCGNLPENEIVKLRRNELFGSSFDLGVFDVRLMEFSDGGFYSDYDITCGIARIIGEIKPDVVFVTDPDVKTEFNPDHKRIGNIVKTVISQSANSKIMHTYGAGTADVKAVAFYFTSNCNCNFRSKKFGKIKIDSILNNHLSQFPKGSPDSENLIKYLKIKKFFGIGETYKVIHRICMHCFPEVDL